MKQEKKNPYDSPMKNILESGKNLGRVNWDSWKNK
jgi:hypothetical protein